MRNQHSGASSTSHQRYERHPVSCEIDGDVFTGNYWVAGMILVVSTATGAASRQLAGQQPEVLAKALLTNLALARRQEHAGSDRGGAGVAQAWGGA